MRSRRLLTTVALALGVGGVVGSTVAARAVADNGAADRRAAFTERANEVASTLRLDLRHEEDLVVNAAGQLRTQPRLTTTQLRDWLRSVHGFERYPELEGIGHLVFVDHDQLADHAATVMADPPGLVGEQGFQVVPAGDRPVYCLLAAAVAKPEATPPAGFDFCGDGGGKELFRARDTGKASYTPVDMIGLQWLGVYTPVYRGGIVPETLAARREAYLGVIGMITRPSVVIEHAIGDRRDIHVRLDHVDIVGRSPFVSGPRLADPESVSIPLDSGWTVTISHPKPAVGLWADHNARNLLAGGVLTSVLLGLLIFVLATTRQRALRLVAEKTDQLRYQALHDPLTGLANRTLVADRAEQLLARSRRSGSSPACLYLDLDGFKGVNDTLGHEAGDLLLRGVSGRLRNAVREADTIARMGGDEFVVLIDGAAIGAAPELVAERLIEVLRQPFELDGYDTPVRVSASIGLATGGRESADDLLRDADLALYEAKGAGKNRFAVYRPEMHSVAQDGVELELAVRMSLERGELGLVYQPMYNLDDLTLIGVEALLRWHHPSRGVLLPDMFIPILERTGQIVEVGEWVLDEACRQMAEWHRQGSDLTISVNLSARQFDSDRIVGQVEAALQRSTLDPSRLTVEVTESAIMRDPAASIERLGAIKRLGVQVAIDDFGTGYSSLASLQVLPVDSLKIDKSFIEAMESPEARAIVRTIVQLGKDLGLKTLAEGVETAEQVDVLRGDAIDEAQGFLLSHPVDGATFERDLLFAEVTRVRGS